MHSERHGWPRCWVADEEPDGQIEIRAAEDVREGSSQSAMHLRRSSSRRRRNANLAILFRWPWASLQMIDDVDWPMTLVVRRLMEDRKMDDAVGREYPSVAKKGETLGKSD